MVTQFVLSRDLPRDLCYPINISVLSWLWCHPVILKTSVSCFKLPGSDQQSAHGFFVFTTKTFNKYSSDSNFHCILYSQTEAQSITTLHNQVLSQVQIIPNLRNTFPRGTFTNLYQPLLGIYHILPPTVQLMEHTERGFIKSRLYRYCPFSPTCCPRCWDAATVFLAIFTELKVNMLKHETEFWECSGPTPGSVLQIHDWHYCKSMNDSTTNPWLTVLQIHEWQYYKFLLLTVSYLPEYSGQIRSYICILDYSLYKLL